VDVTLSRHDRRRPPRLPVPDPATLRDLRNRMLATAYSDQSSDSDSAAFLSVTHPITQAGEGSRRRRRSSSPTASASPQHQRQRHTVSVDMPTRVDGSAAAVLGVPCLAAHKPRRTSKQTRGSDGASAGSRRRASGGSARTTRVPSRRRSGGSAAASAFAARAENRSERHLFEAPTALGSPTATSSMAATPSPWERGALEDACSIPPWRRQHVQEDKDEGGQADHEDEEAVRRMRDTPDAPILAATAPSAPMPVSSSGQGRSHLQGRRWTVARDVAASGAAAAAAARASSTSHTEVRYACVLPRSIAAPVNLSRARTVPSVLLDDDAGDTEEVGGTVAAGAGSGDLRQGQREVDEANAEEEQAEVNPAFRFLDEHEGDYVTSDREWSDVSVHSDASQERTAGVKGFKSLHPSVRRQDRRRGRERMVVPDAATLRVLTRRKLHGWASDDVSTGATAHAVTRPPVAATSAFEESAGAFMEDSPPETVDMDMASDAPTTSTAAHATAPLPSQATQAPLQLAFQAWGRGPNGSATTAPAARRAQPTSLQCAAGTIPAAMGAAARSRIVQVGVVSSSVPQKRSRRKPESQRTVGKVRPPRAERQSKC
jgi:hypothetical protein